ncbi:SDR family NAD(P)-dependent oxidoreductase [Microcoleus sp. w1-18aA5]|jgi:NAD(P)-dependent dehydrogenase (short-subunit alcohol dehydrogenase family)|uniref:SDR family NAD(P)-dependent oxidoreductase n=1 Tax=unclassified Microcoleus TaxID=2642155 RepID=UPI002FD18075
MTKDKTKIALVTGASRGLGKNTALTLARKGVDVIVTYHNSEEDAQNVVSAIEAIGAKAVALQYVSLIKINLTSRKILANL